LRQVIDCSTSVQLSVHHCSAEAYLGNHCVLVGLILCYTFPSLWIVSGIDEVWWNGCTVVFRLLLHVVYLNALLVEGVFIIPLKPQWLVYVTPSSTFTSSRSARTLNLCNFYGSLNKQQLFLCTAVTDWVCITETDCVYRAVRLNL